MNAPEWLKPALYGAAAGAVALARACMDKLAAQF